MNKYISSTIGGVIGGVFGWLVADYILYKLDEKDSSFVDFWPVEAIERPGGMDRELYEEFEKDKNDKTNYAGMVKKVIRKEVQTLDDISRQEAYAAESEPFVTILEDWDEDMLGDAQHYTISYYPEDGVYCYEDEQLVEDPDNTFVPNAFLHFGEGSEDEDIVYIRNPRRNAIYEIIRLPGKSYKIDVLGEIEEEEPVKKTRRKRTPKPGSVNAKKAEAESLGGEDEVPEDGE